MKNSMQISLESKNILAIWPSNPTTVYIPKRHEHIELKVYCTAMFTVLFTITRIYNQYRYLLPERWIKKMWCAYTDTQKVTSFSYNEMKFCHFHQSRFFKEDIILSDLSQSEKDKYCLFSHIWELKFEKKMFKKECLAYQYG